MEGIVCFCPQFKRFHREVIMELEKKTEMDVKYMNVSVIISESFHQSPPPARGVVNAKLRL